ncbi:UNVERIFIED_ORG: branched-chain amino acid transport system ATP-binding protein [Rhodococcus erythropolis]
MTNLLEAQSLQAGYGDKNVLHDVTFAIPEGQIVVLLGANGAGKTTTMRALSGTLPIKGGTVRFAGEETTGASVRRLVRRGMSLVPQGRGTFPELTVLENLQIGAYQISSGKQINADIALWFERFPRLGERHAQKAGTLSGGEQQMLAIARAMMSRPQLLLLDEPSLGLAPLIVQELFELLRQLNSELRTSMLIVEQSAELALDIADFGYVLETGHTVLSGAADDLRANEAVRTAYLGI